MVNYQKATAGHVNHINELTAQRNKLLLTALFNKWVKMESIKLTEYDIKTLDRAYKKAVKAGAESFKVKLTYKEVELVTEYAKYLLQYLKGL